MRALLVLLFTLVFSVGCMGAVNSLTDLDLSVELGENAVHPSDFPVSAPASGERVMSMRMKAGADNLNLPEGVEVDLKPDGKYQLEMVAYEVLPADAAALMDAARQEALAAGFTEIASDGTAVTYTRGDAIFVIVDPASEGTLTLLRLVPAAEEAASPQ